MSDRITQYLTYGLLLLCVFSAGSWLFSDAWLERTTHSSSATQTELKS